MTIEKVKRYLLNLQSSLCTQLEQEDGTAQFISDDWQRPEGGGGCTRIISDGVVFEKGAVNFSHVWGEQLPPSATANRPELAGKRYQALGVSIVIHPCNPYVPTSHANVRFFTTEADDDNVWWFGGGFDLTPYYGFDEDCQYWHRTAKAACDPFGEDIYPRYKKSCDDYFYLKHRDEQRGIGGLFFDDENSLGFERNFALMQAIGDAYGKAYLPIVAKRKGHPFGERERQFQCYRRGRYVEFNLVYDRGTLFGLQSGGRTESILASLPPLVRWDYNWSPPPDSVEGRLLNDYLQAREWV